MNIIAPAFIAALLGIVFGSHLNQQITVRDCESLGAFRVGNKVFICEVKK